MPAVFDTVYTWSITDDVLSRFVLCTGFDWDDGNAPKIGERRGVSEGERKQVFFGGPLLVARDVAHATTEERWVALGVTLEGRPLAIIFTLRGDRTRLISARDLSRKERRLYAEAEAEDQAYQSLMKIYLSERVALERRRRRKARS